MFNLKKYRLRLLDIVTLVLSCVLLAMALYPLAAQYAQHAANSSCANRQRIIAQALLRYARDHAGQLPDSSAVWSSLSLARPLLTCPAARSGAGNDYAYNGYLSRKRLSLISAPAAVALIADGAGGASSVPNVAFTCADLARRHENNVIAAYVDGHVASSEAVRLADLQLPKSCLLWLASDGLVSEQGGVKKWVDFSGNHLDAVQNEEARRPIFSTFAIGEQPGATFNGGPTARAATKSSCLVLPRIHADFAPGTTLFLVTARTGKCYYSNILSLQSHGLDDLADVISVNCLLAGPYNDLICFSWNEGTDNYSGLCDGFRTAVNVPVLYSMVAQPQPSRDHLAKIAIYRDGAPTPTATKDDAYNAPPVNEFNQNWIGGEIGGSNTDFSGTICELLLFTRALNDGERRGVEDYLLSKYTLKRL